MSHAEYESLSAMVDGELDSDQFSFMLRRVQGSVSLKAKWERYHVVGAGLRREMDGLVGTALAERVMHDIGRSPSKLRSRRSSHRWLRWSAGGAIAAGVAVAALVVLQPDGRHLSPHAGGAVASGPALAASASNRNVARASDRSVTTPEVPRWLSASPGRRMAQRAAATFTPLGEHVGDAAWDHDASPARAPYMVLPQPDARSAPGARSAARQHTPWWPATRASGQQPDRAAARQPQ